MEVAVELEDDVFFADLNKQISLLIMDDDEDPVVHCPSVSLQAISKAVQPATQPSFSYIRESKGTGVFIPQSSSHPRRKNKQGKFSSSSSSSSSPSSSNAKLHRHSGHSSRGLLPLAAYNYSNNIPSHNISFNPKRS